MKQQLSEALDRIDDLWLEVVPSSSALNQVLAAARLVERLLPGECGICYGGGFDGPPSSVDEFRRACERCYGVGQVWDEGIVEAVATTICRIDNDTGPDVAIDGVPCDLHRSVARAVLSALVELLTEKVP